MAHVAPVLVDVIVRLDGVGIDRHVLAGDGLKPYDSGAAGLAARDAALMLFRRILGLEAHRGTEL